MDSFPVGFPNTPGSLQQGSSRRLCTPLESLLFGGVRSTSSYLGPAIAAGFSHLLLLWFSSSRLYRVLPSTRPFAVSVELSSHQSVWDEQASWQGSLPKRQVERVWRP